MSDIDRINFLIDRESDPQKVIDFAVQAKNQYKKAALASKRKYGKGGVYRRAYAESYLFYKKFVELNTVRTIK